MKIAKYILSLCILLVSCVSNHHRNDPTISGNMTQYDSIYITADIRWHKQYYPLLDRQVFSIDLITDGLIFDSVWNIQGTGQNLYVSDIFLPLTDTLLQEGVYQLDSIPSAFTILPYKDFEGGRPTGCYMIDIANNSINKIFGFVTGSMLVEYLNATDIRLEFSLYTTDSVHYRAVYQGPFEYHD